MVRIYDMCRNSYKIAIIGAGASGCACAASLSNTDLANDTVVIEKSDRICKKLAATGNGQGNISNENIGLDHYFGSVKFISEKIIHGYDPCKMLSILVSKDDKGRIYPYSRQASSIGDIFLDKILSSGIDLILNDGVESLSRSGSHGDDGLFVIKLSSGRVIFSEYIVLSTGGKAARQYKTDGTAYSFAENLGHSITELYPSLVQLKTDTTYIKGLKGIRVNARVTAYSGNTVLTTTDGDVIFTDYGVSGNAIFYVSAFVSDKKNASISFDFMPEYEEADIASFLEIRSNFIQNCSIMSGILHNRLSKNIFYRAEKCGLPVERVIKNFSLRVTGSLGFDFAQVTKGGIPASEIYPSLESRICHGLYFTGEILDIDGVCGGYNLHFAFCSGMHVAEELLFDICR